MRGRVGEHDVAECLLDDRGDRSVGDALLTCDRLDRCGELPGREPQDRGQGEGGEGQVPAQPQGRGREQYDVEDRGNDADDAGDDHLLDGLDVSRQPLHQVALAVSLEEVRRQVLDVPEDAGTQPHDEALRGPHGSRVAGVSDSGAEERDGQPLARRYPEGAE